MTYELDFSIWFQAKTRRNEFVQGCWDRVEGAVDVTGEVNHFQCVPKDWAEIPHKVGSMQRRGF